jgi:hypothetical protein
VDDDGTVVVDDVKTSAIAANETTRVERQHDRARPEQLVVDLGVAVENDEAEAAFAFTLPFAFTFTLSLAFTLTLSLTLTLTLSLAFTLSFAFAFAFSFSCVDDVASIDEVTSIDEITSIDGLSGIDALACVGGGDARVGVIDDADGVAGSCGLHERRDGREPDPFTAGQAARFA